MPLLEGNASPGPRSSRFSRFQRFGSSSTTAKAGVKKNHSAPSGNGGGTSPFFFNATIIQNNDRCRHREPASLYMTRRVVLGHVGSMVDISTGWVNRNHLKQHLQTPEGFPRISSATVLR